MDKKKSKEKAIAELVKPVLEKEQLSIIRSVLKHVKEFNLLSNFARMDIAQNCKAVELPKKTVVIDMNQAESTDIFVLVEGKVRLFTSEKKFIQYAKENEMESYLNQS